MSKSYKKTPRCGNKKDKFFKRYYNKRVRKDISETSGLNHNQYKKYKQAYDICDYESVGCQFSQHWEQCIKKWYQWRYLYEPFPDEKEEYRKWYRWYKSK